MKQYIAIIILALCMVACGRDSKHREMLMQVESFMEERPDSALIVLKSIDIEDDEYGQMLMHYVQGRLQQEEEDYPASIISMLNDIKDSEKLIITPHMAWGSVEARTRIVEAACENIRAFLNGDRRNRVDL